MLLLFIRVIENQKEREEKFDDESDMIDAFIACGGNPDKGGHVKKETLVKIIKHDFGLTIDIEELINKIDTDGSGEIEYGEFKTQDPALLSELGNRTVHKDQRTILNLAHRGTQMQERTWAHHKHTTRNYCSLCRLTHCRQVRSVNVHIGAVGIQYHYRP